MVAKRVPPALSCMTMPSLPAPTTGARRLQKMWMPAQDLQTLNPLRRGGQAASMALRLDWVRVCIPASGCPLVHNQIEQG